MEFLLLGMRMPVMMLISTDGEINALRLISALAPSYMLNRG
jgi:hypothetical protein